MISLKDRIHLVLSQRPEMVTTRAEAATHPGFTVQEFEELGLDKAQLKKLERLGFALRGYTRNRWEKGDKLPSGKIADGTYVGTGVRAKYILVAE